MVEYIEGSTPMPDLTGMEGRCISCGLLAKTPGTARIANQNLLMYEVTAEERILKHPNASFHPGLGDRKSIGQCFAGIPFKTHMRQLADNSTAFVEEIEEEKHCKRWVSWHPNLDPRWH